MELHELISKRFYDTRFLTNGSSDEVVNNLNRTYQAYMTALERYENYKSSGKNVLISPDNINNCLKVFPFLSVNQSVSSSTHRGELVISSKNFPTYANWKYSVIDNQITIPPEVANILNTTPELKSEQVLLVSPEMYSSEAIFTRNDVTVINTTLTSFETIKTANIDIVDSLAPKRFREVMYKVSNSKCITPFSTSSRGIHPHINSEGRICYGSHNFLGNYNNLLSSTQTITPTQIMIGVIYDYLDWLQHTTIDDNYHNNMLVQNPHIDAKDVNSAKNLINQYSDPEKMSIIIELIKYTRDIILKYWDFYFSDGKTPQVADIIRILTQELCRLDLEDGNVVNSHILSILIALTTEKGCSSKGYMLVLPSILSKLYLVFLRYYIKHIPGSSATAARLIDEGLEHVLNYNIETQKLNYSEKVLKALINTPKGLLIRVLLTTKENPDNKEFLDNLRRLV